MGGGHVPPVLPSESAAVIHHNMWPNLQKGSYTRIRFSNFVEA